MKVPHQCLALHVPDLQLTSQNVFNVWRPDLSLTTYRPLTASGRLASYGRTGLWRPIPSFTAWAAGLLAPAGNLTNAVRLDRAGAARTATRNAPGAYVPPLASG